MLQRERNEILEATVEDMRALAPLVEAVLDDRQICVVGSEPAMKKAGDILTEIKPLIR